MLVIWMILDKVDEMLQLEQVDQLVEVDEIEQEDEVYMKWINWIKWLQNWPKLQSMATMCLSEYLMVERPENLEKCILCLKEYFVLVKKKNIFLIFGFDAKIVGVCAAWNVACRRIAPPATLQTNFPTKYARAKNTASVIIKRQAWARFSEFCWFLIKISLIGERQWTKTNVWVFLSGGSGRHDISW